MSDPGQSPSRAADLGVWTRRAVIGSMAAAGLGFILFGPRAARTAPHGRVVLNYWEKWTGQEGSAMQRVVNAFNESQDRIWVQYFSMSPIDQKAMISIAGGDPPDLLGLWNFSIPAFSQAGAIEPLDGMIDQWGAEIERTFAERYGDDDGFVLRAERYKAPVWKLQAPAGRGGGRLWGVVNTCNTLGLVYDRRAVREAGMDPDAPPRTIEELDTFAERLTTYRDGRRGSSGAGEIDRIGFIHREPGWWNWIWGHCFGGELYDAKRGAITADAPANVRGYEWVQSYPERYGLGRLVSLSSGFGTYNSAQQPLLAGKVASALHGAFIGNLIRTFDPNFELGAAPFPVEASIYDPDRPIGLLESDLLVIPRGCPHPREAFEFLCFTQRQWSTEQLAIGHAKPAPLARVSPGFEAAHPNPKIDVFNRIAGSERAFGKPETVVWPQYEGEFNAVMDPLWKGERSARVILEGVQRTMERHLNAANARRARRDGTGA